MRQFILIITALFIITGCASVPKQAFNSEANANLQQIAVANPPAVDQVEVRILTHPGQSFGLIGAMVAEADMAAKAGRYNESLANKTD